MRRLPAARNLGSIQAALIDRARKLGASLGVGVRRRHFRPLADGEPPHFLYPGLLECPTTYKTAGAAICGSTPLRLLRAKERLTLE
jgi:hypothetical protein